MIKKLIYDIIVFFDKIFIYFQFIIIKFLSGDKKIYSLIEGGWGVLIQSIFYLNLIHKENVPKTIIILDSERYNFTIQEFARNCKIFRIFSVFIFLNKNFSQYPKEFRENIKRYCKKIFSNSYKDMSDIIYDKKRNFFNEKILSKYILKKISNEKIFSWFLHSLNDSQNGLKKKIFEPKKISIRKIEKIFNLKINEIKNSINICIRQRNKILKNVNISKKQRSKIFKNISRTNYLRDGNIDNFKIAINYLLKNYDFKIFLTGDIDDININHKNFFTYKNFSKKISKNFYELSVQTLSKFHILNSSGASKIVEFNNINDSKILFIDAWPPITFTANSIFLFKNIIGDNNKNINSYEYLKMYERACRKQKNKDSFDECKKIYLKFYEAKNYKIISNNERQVLESLKEFIIFISNKKKLNFKNKYHKKVPKYFQKVLLENKCLLSSGNL